MLRGAGQWLDRYRYHLGAGSVASGLALAPEPGEVAVITAAVVLLVACAGRRPGLGAGVAALLIAGAGVGELRLRAIDGPGERLEPYEQLDTSAVLLERPRTSGLRAQAAVRIESGAKLLAVPDGPWTGPDEPGTIVRVRGVVKPPTRSEDARFDWPAHLRRRGMRTSCA